MCTAIFSIHWRSSQTPGTLSPVTGVGTRLTPTTDFPFPMRLRVLPTSFSPPRHHVRPFGDQTVTRIAHYYTRRETEGWSLMSLLDADDAKANDGLAHTVGARAVEIPLKAAARETNTLWLDGHMWWARWGAHS